MGHRRRLNAVTRQTETVIGDLCRPFVPVTKLPEEAFKTCLSKKAIGCPAPRIFSATNALRDTLLAQLNTFFRPLFVNKIVVIVIDE